MRFRMSDLAARSGLQARTIRDYVKNGYLAPPQGHGPGASYDEEQMLRVVTIARMREKRAGWNEIIDFLEGASIAKLRAYVKKTDPSPPDPVSSAATDGPREAPPAPERLDGAAPPAGLPPSPSRDPHASSLDADHDEGAALEGGVGFVMVNVLPGLALMMREDASPLVKRVAREMLRRYGVR